MTTVISASLQPKLTLNFTNNQFCNVHVPMHIGGTALAMSTSIARTPAMLGHSMSTRTMFVRTSVQSAETFMNGGLETICASVCPSLQLAMPLTVRIWTL